LSDRSEPGEAAAAKKKKKKRKKGKWIGVKECTHRVSQCDLSALSNKLRPPTLFSIQIPPHFTRFRPHCLLWLLFLPEPLVSGSSAVDHDVRFPSWSLSACSLPQSYVVDHGLVWLSAHRRQLRPSSCSCWPVLSSHHWLVQPPFVQDDRDGLELVRLLVCLPS
jgi:hypothetical protein